MKENLRISVSNLFLSILVSFIVSNLFYSGGYGLILFYGLGLTILILNIITSIFSLFIKNQLFVCFLPTLFSVVYLLYLLMTNKIGDQAHFTSNLIQAFVSLILPFFISNILIYFFLYKRMK